VAIQAEGQFLTNKPSARSHRALQFAASWATDETEPTMETEVELRAAMLAAIGHELRLVYADILAQGVPERFAGILRRLDDPSNEGSPPPAAPQCVSRDDENGSEGHERRALALRRARSTGSKVILRVARLLWRLLVFHKAFVARGQERYALSVSFC
jgi:hypothetical protein